MVFKEKNVSETPGLSAEEKNLLLEAEVSRLKNYENIVSGLMQHDSICLAVFQKNPPRAVFINRGLEILTGYTKEEIYNFTISEFEEIILPEFREEFFERYYRRLNGEPLPNNYELKLFSKDKVPLTVQAFVYRIEYDGEPSIVITFVDISKTREAETALNRSRESFKEMIDRSPLPIVVIDVDDNIIYNNAECFRVFGFLRKEITDINLWWENAYPDPQYRQAVIDDWYSDYKNSQKRREMFGPKEYKVTCSDGSVKDIEFHVVPVGEKSFVIMNDMTRHRKAEMELLKTKKIESLGILAGGIAHDFNNILTAVIGNLNLAKMDIPAEHKTYSLLESVEKAAWRAKDLTQQLLTFSRGGSPVRRVTSVKQLLVDFTGFALAGSDVRAEFNIAENLWDAEIDEGQIGQVIHNLVMNARESITGGGVVTITADNFVCEGDECLIYSGDFICIRIEDSGKGMPQSIIQNIFDPFFTTKAAGTGLGLSVSYSIVKKHGGDIKVTSSEGEGTVFEIFLPARKSGPGPERFSEPVESTAGGRILVMDDEDLILDISKKMLNRMGYTVDLCRCGEEAVSLYKEAKVSGAPYDCVIMDLTIPGGMGGKDVLLVLKDYDPYIKAIVSSGYSNDPVMSMYREYGFAGVSEKPYSFEDLKSEIEKVLSGNR